MATDYIWNQFIFRLQLLQFLRDANGRPNYSAGLRSVEASYYVTPIGPTLDINEETRDSIVKATEEEFARVEKIFKGTVLVDNGDAFFLNMIPPHNVLLMNNMLAEKPMIFTMDSSPPLTRLNFPFLIGSNEKQLDQDLFNYLQTYISNYFDNFKVKYGNFEYDPYSRIELQAIRVEIDDS